MNNSIYWKRKNEMKETAIRHTAEMKSFFSEETQNSIKKSEFIDYSDHDAYMESIKPIEFGEGPTNIIIMKGTTVEAIQRYRNEPKLASLNFASYKNPGGKFIEGSMAQEESLCHSSNLYNILSSDRCMKEFYKPNKNRTNKCLYEDTLIYTPGVVFDQTPTSQSNIEPIKTRCAVITCAAPNATAAKKYYGVSKKDISLALFWRIHSVLLCARDHKIKTLILGAFGCGVFGNDIVEVANTFSFFLNTEFRNTFDTVIFAIPELYDGDRSYDIFEDAFNATDRMIINDRQKRYKESCIFKDGILKDMDIDELNNEE